MDRVDSFKLRILREKLKEEGIRKPKRADIERILGVSYPQAYNYLRALNEKEVKK